MEYHIFSNPTPSHRGGRSSVGSVLRKFIPIFALAAILPVLLFAAGNTVDYDFTSSANTDPVLRVWIEPASVVLTPGESISVKVVGNLESDREQVHTVTASIPAIPGLRINASEVKHLPPFRGQTTLGEVQITAVNRGSYTLEIPESLITTSISDLEIVSSPGTIQVQ